jgi:hypothetical protein
MVKSCLSLSTNLFRKLIMGVGYMYRVTRKGEQMRIGSNEVTEVTRNSVKVGCQVVTRAEAEEVLKQMNAASEFQLRVENSIEPGSVYLVQAGERIYLKMRDKMKREFHLISLGLDGFKRSDYCSGCGLPVEDGSLEKVKILNNPKQQ